MYRASNANLTMYGAKFDRKRYEAFHGELETAESGQ